MVSEDVIAILVIVSYLVGTIIGYHIRDTLEEKDIDFSDERINNCLDTIVKLGVTDKEKWKKKPGPLCPWCDYFIAGICEGNKVDFNYE
jgi:hypothetical protein